MMSGSASSSPDRVSLKKRVLRAGTWSLAGYGVGQAIRFGSNLLMTRLLVPDMFGVMAIANIVLAGISMFSDLGLRQNIVQSKHGSDPEFLNTAWVIQICRGFVLSLCALSVGLLLLFADHIGTIPQNSTYSDPRLPYVIAVLSLGFFIGGFQSTKLFEASRNLALGQITKIDITTQIVGLLVTIGWAVFDRSIWALVAGNFCGALVMTLMSHISLPGVSNRWEWSSSAFREIIHFVKWMFLSSIFGYLVTTGDRLLLGGLIDATMLGIYAIAFGIFSSVGQLLDKIISDVGYSALSEVIRERPAELKSSYYRFYIIIASVAYFCAGILMFSGQSIIAVLYDHRYEQAGWMLQVLATALLIVPFHLAVDSLLALGLPRIFTQILAVRGVALFVLLPVAFHFFGLPGAIWAIVASYFAMLPLTLYHQIKRGFFDPWKTLLPVLAWGPGVFLAECFNIAVGRG